MYAPGGPGGPIPGIICWGEKHQFEVRCPNNHLDIPEAGTRKEGKRIRNHELPRLELQNLLHTTEVE